MLSKSKTRRRARRHGFMTSKRKNSPKATKTVIGRRRAKGRKVLAVQAFTKAA